MLATAMKCSLENQCGSGTVEARLDTKAMKSLVARTVPVVGAAKA